MAQIIGESGAWEDVCSIMAKEGLFPEQISDIKTFLEQEKKTLQNLEESKPLEKELQRLLDEKEKINEAYQAVLSSNKKKIFARLKKLSTEIEELQKPAPLNKKIRHIYQIRQLKQKRKLLKQQAKAYFKKLERKRDAELKKAEEKYQKNKAVFSSKIKKTKRKIHLLQDILTSPEYLGAIAEIRLIELLRSLPEDYYVLNNVNLSLDKAMRFDDKWRKTAQIDTMVISQSGIFVIEVKNWSKDFVDSHSYHNPFDQVKWAAYLCHKETRVKTRSILAHTGHIPRKPSDTYTKLKQLNEVKGYILYFDQQKIIRAERVQKLVNSLK